MHKLTLSDIKIKKPGKQLEEVIIKTYGSVENFAQLINRYPESISSYLRDKNCGSNKFKTTLLGMLNKSYDDIVKTGKQQIKEMVEAVSCNIKLYDSPKDIAILERLKDLCIKEGMEKETAMMLFNIAVYNRRRANTRVAVELLKHAVSIMDNIEELEYTVKILSELGLAYYLEHAYEKAKAAFQEAESNLEKISVDNNTRFLLYYRIGILLNNISLHSQARERFADAIKYSDNDTDTANATMNIGLTYKKEQNYTKAIEFFNTALKIFNPDNKDEIGKTYNNLAEVYRSMKDYTNALEYIEKALKIEKNTDMRHLSIKVQTYIQIRIDMKEPDNAIEKLLDLLENSGESYSDKKYIASGIEILTKHAVQSKDIKNIDKVKKLIMNIIEKNQLQDSIIKELKICMGEISLALLEGGDENEG